MIFFLLYITVGKLLYNSYINRFVGNFMKNVSHFLVKKFAVTKSLS